MNRPLLLTPLLLLAGCADLGDRAGSGECPPGEDQCSDLTPYGLEFTGASFSDDSLFADPGIKTVAVGGTQRIDVFDHEDGSPLTVPYRAAFVGGPLTVSSTSGNRVDLDAVAPGSGRLELRDSDDALLDRVSVSSAAIASIELRPAAFSDLLGQPRGPIALWSGAVDLRLAVALFAGDLRLVDENAQIIPVTGDAAVTAWDGVSVAEVTGDLAIQVLAGDLLEPVELTAPQVSVLDGATASRPFATEEPARVGDGELICFHGLNNEAEVLGVPWDVSIEGPATLTDDGETFGANCVQVSLDAVGTVRITGAAPGTSVSLSLDVIDGSSKPRRSLTPAPMSPTFGDRAR